jgi:cysteine synthase B
METAIVPGIYDPGLASEDLRVTTEDAYTMVRRLAREEGLLVGISGGAALAAALKVAETVRNAVIVTVFPDSADKYMSERFWNAPG